MCLIFTDFLRPVFYRTLMHDISNMIRHLYHCLSRLHYAASDLCIWSARENRGDGRKTGAPNGSVPHNICSTEKILLAGN